MLQSGPNSYFEILIVSKKPQKNPPKKQQTFFNFENGISIILNTNFGNETLYEIRIREEFGHAENNKLWVLNWTSDIQPAKIIE